MNKILILLFICSFNLSVYAKDFGKTEKIINTILSQHSREKSAGRRIIPKAETGEKGRGDENKDSKEIKAAGMSSPDEILLKSGIQLTNSNLPDHAMEKFRELIEKFPRSPYLDIGRNWLAKIYMKKYRYDDAIKELSAIPADSGEYPAALYNTGICYLVKGDEIKSLDFFHRVYTRYPQHPLADNAMLSTGKIFLKNGKGDQAMESAIRLIKNYGKRETADDAYYLLGKVFEKDPRLKDPESARRVYIRFLKLADSGKPVFSSSPLKSRIRKDLRYIEKNYFRLDN